MKNLFVFVLAILFLANTFVVSAWAKPCMFGAPPQKTQTAHDTPPCHEGAGSAQNERGEKNGAAHCDGLCLCLHVAHSPTAAAHDGLPVSGFVRMPAHFAFFFDDTLMTGMQSSPIPPPKIFS